MARRTSGRQTCGFCATGHHSNCVPMIKNYEIVWTCKCSVCFADIEIEEEDLEEESEDEATL